MSYYQNRRPELVERVPVRALRILDIGCGQGGLSAGIKEVNTERELWGVEYLEEQARTAEASGVFHCLLAGDISERLAELPDGYFDCIMCADVLEHLVDPWAVLSSLKTKLNSEGVLIASIPNICTFSFVISLLTKRSFEYKDEGVLDRTHLRFFARKDIQAMFERAGFHAIKIEPSRGNKKLFKRITRAIFGDYLIKSLTVQAS